mgnify:CR=1 FL=1
MFRYCLSNIQCVNTYVFVYVLLDLLKRKALSILVNIYGLKYNMGHFYNQWFTVIVNLIIADQMLNDPLCCPYKYNWCLCRFIANL